MANRITGRNGTLFIDDRPVATTTTTTWDLGGAIIPNALYETEMAQNPFAGLRAALTTNPKPPKPKKHISNLAPLRDQLQALLLEGDRGYGKSKDLPERLRYLSYEIAELETEEAKEKALETLIERLDKEQRKSFKDGKGYFKVSGKKMTYKLSLFDPITIVGGPNKGTFLCIYSTDRKAPKADELLGAKLYIESNETEFLKTANPQAQMTWYLDPDGKRCPRDDPRYNFFADRLFRPQPLHPNPRTHAEYQERYRQLRERLDQQTAALWQFQVQPEITRTDVTAFGDTTHTYITNTTNTLRATGPDGALTVDPADLDTAYPTFTFTPAPDGRMANHQPGRLDPAHCADCTRIHGDLQRINNAWPR